ncbi:conserved hypothetical protein [Aspergillus terreus NIH2624]|uniref:Uncharacterized protein n=1 Tax=Aspergillus terreus (strain NIH 2624 / FGSC A1156) TaxID=341663 RepID=Q0CL44_ASPTN|nr:uncharacterized protein ATEG_05590 [Aspergillus terreus NIH2624]EAU34659.1 conserved hypothetical protein [Aspergillus terreus NIH2624]
MSGPNAAFTELAQIFRNRNGRILEFEILPPALGPLLQDGCSIGITKKYMAQAFVAARKIFFSDSVLISGSSPSNKSPESDNRLDDLSVSSEIILLFDCEHTTACNWRKKRLRDMMQSLGLTNPASREALISLLHSELTLMTTYVCSPLRRHTKSPTLWEHRLWVLKHLLFIRRSGGTSGAPQTPDCEATAELWEQELTTVLRAGELHPRNYYAFSYIRELHDVLSLGTDNLCDCYLQLGRRAVDPTLTWCLAHTTDISGWMFLLYLLGTVPDPTLRTDTVRKVVCFARDVGWEGESLWTFVDLAVCAFDLFLPVKNELCPAHNASSEDAAKPGTGWKGWLAMAKAYWTANR